MSVMFAKYFDMVWHDDVHPQPGSRYFWLSLPSPELGLVSDFPEPASSRVNGLEPHFFSIRSVRDILYRIQTSLCASS